MKIKHKLIPSEIKYGYIYWKTIEDNKMKDLLGRQKRITLIFPNGKKVNANIEFNQRRVYITKILQNEFNVKSGDEIILKKENSGLFSIKILK